MGKWCSFLDAISVVSMTTFSIYLILLWIWMCQLVELLFWCLQRKLLVLISNSGLKIVINSIILMFSIWSTSSLDYENSQDVLSLSGRNSQDFDISIDIELKSLGTVIQTVSSPLSRSCKSKWRRYMEISLHFVLSLGFTDDIITRCEYRDDL